MPLVKNCRVVEDVFTRVSDEAPIPANGAVIVSAERFLAEADHFSRRVAPSGLVWPNNRPIAELEPYLGYADLVALVFPKFRDGRAYSQARLLRERYRYHGELRATGEVLRDQFLFLLRAGFNSFEVMKPGDAAVFAEAIRRYDTFYQPTGDGRTTVPGVRLARQRRQFAATGNHVPAL